MGFPFVLRYSFLFASGTNLDSFFKDEFSLNRNGQFVFIQRFPRFGNEVESAESRLSAKLTVTNQQLSISSPGSVFVARFTRAKNSFWAASKCVGMLVRDQGLVSQNLLMGGISSYRVRGSRF